MRPAFVFRTGFLAGLLAASATAGVLVGLGVRAGEAGSLLALGGRQVIGLPAPERVAIAIGVLRHIVAFLLVGLLAATIAGAPRLRAAGRLLRLLLLVALLWSAQRVVPTVALPLAVDLPWAPALLFHLVEFGALYLGIRLALDAVTRRGDDETPPPPDAYSTRETIVT